MRFKFINCFSTAQNKNRFETAAQSTGSGSTKPVTTDYAKPQVATDYAKPQVTTDYAKPQVVTDTKAGGGTSVYGEPAFKLLVYIHSSKILQTLFLQGSQVVERCNIRVTKHCLNGLIFWSFLFLANNNNRVGTAGTAKLKPMATYITKPHVSGGGTPVYGMSAFKLLSGLRIYGQFRDSRD